MDKATDFSDIWNFDNPDQTRIKFSTLLDSMEESSPKALEVITQIVRTYGLERKFEQGHNLLNNHIKRLEQAQPVPKTRYHLERGRLYNSNNLKDKALIEFHAAWELATFNDLHYLAVDAAHMIAIARENLHERINWNMKAINYAESSPDKITRKWLGSLYNNTGWDYHDLEQYDKALELFEKALTFHEKNQNKNAVRIAQWTIGRVYRSLERYDDALEIMHRLEKEEQQRDEITASGYVKEELGELYLTKKQNKKAAKYFKKAFNILSKDKSLLLNQQNRLQRIKKLSSLDN